MEKIEVTVVMINVYRDGGTTVYRDSLNRLYFQSFVDKKIYNQYPEREDMFGPVKPYIKEIPVKLRVVKNLKISRTNEPMESKTKACTNTVVSGSATDKTLFEGLMDADLGRCD